MQYESIVYFHGPETNWAAKVSEREIIARKSFPFRWAARAWARNTYRNLDHSKCGWAVLVEGDPIEHVEALQ
jgi:hypothetical protein